MAKRILFINQEITPYVPENELSILGKILPQGIQESGYEIRTFMPKWGVINERRGQLHEVIRLSGMNLIIDDTDHPLIIKVASIPTSRIQVYFIDNDDYFHKRMMAENEEGVEYEDNGERAIFFARGVLETVKKLRWTPDLILCQGWMGAVVPLYIKKAYYDEPSFANTKVITSLFGQNIKQSLGEHFKSAVSFRDINEETLNAYSDDFSAEDLTHMAIDYSDGIIQASPNVEASLLAYAEEKNKPMLSYSEGEGQMAGYRDFFEKILSV